MLKLIAGLWTTRTDPAPKEKAAPIPPPERGGKRRKTENQFTSYYGRPVIKKPHWVWPIWTYFWVGGIAGGASAITTLVELVGDKERDQSIIRAGRYISLAGMLVSPVLLVIDLQRPERFHHMLRVLKLRSPLSVGTYILTSSGLLTGLNAARQTVEDGLIPAGSLPAKVVLLSANRVTSVAQGLDGLALGSYTGVLLSATAVPLWAEADIVLPPLFLASAFSTGAAAISLARALSGAGHEELQRLDRIEQGAILAELSLLAYGAAKLKPAVRQYTTSGKYGLLFALAISLGQILPFLLQLFSPKRGLYSRVVSLLSPLLVLTGGYLLRVAVVEAGKASAEDPDAYHATTRCRGRPTPEEQAANPDRAN